jgi:predicted phosphate transport protein (TIGR00153 family)
MFGRWTPGRGKFFEHFLQHADLCVKGAQEMAAMMRDFEQREDREVRAHAIEGIEKQADKVTDSTLELLQKSFFTPFDRDDIHKLITRMDDILDLLEDGAQSIYLYDIKSVTPEAGRLADLCLECTEKIRSCVMLMNRMGNGQEILALCEEIDKLESDADHVMRAAMSKLFRDEPDVRNLIKLKAIYEILETVTDRCEDVATLIEGIVIENT